VPKSTNFGLEEKSKIVYKAEVNMPVIFAIGFIIKNMIK
jgi:hypothetical protein